MTLQTNISYFLPSFWFGITKNKDCPERLFQVLLTPQMGTKLQGVEPWVCISQLKRAPSDSRNYTAAGDLKIKLIRKELTTKWTASTQDAGSRLHSLNMKWNSFISSFLYSGTGLERKLSSISLRPLLREDRGLDNLSDCWIYHKKSSLPVHDTRDPLVLPVTNFSSICNGPLTLGVTYIIWLLQPEHPVPCFHLSMITTVPAQLDTNS